MFTLAILFFTVPFFILAYLFIAVHDVHQFVFRPVWEDDKYQHRDNADQYHHAYFTLTPVIYYDAIFTRRIKLIGYIGRRRNKKGKYFYYALSPILKQKLGYE